MEKFCGKCGSKLDEATRLCPNCDADKIKQRYNKTKETEIPVQERGIGSISQNQNMDKRAKKKELKVRNKAAKKEKRANWSTGKKVRRFFLKLILAVVFLAVLAVGITGMLTYSDVIDIPIVEEVLDKLGFYSKGISTSELYQRYSEINNQALKIEEKYANDGSVSNEQLPALLEELSVLAEQYKKQGILESYDVEETSIFMKFKSGVGYLYIPTNKDIMSGDQAGNILTVEPYATSAEFLAQYILGGKSPDKAAEEIAASLPELYVFDDAHNQDGFEIEDVGRLGNNKIIIWYGHGGYISEYGSVLGTSVSIKDKTSLAMYAEELENGEMVLGKDCFCLCPSYLDKHIADGSLKGSMVYLAACESGRDNRLADVFFRKGATLVVGNTRSIFTRYNLYMMYNFLIALTNTYDDGTYWTAEDALQYAKDENGETDGKFMFYGAEVRLIYPNNESGYRLKPVDALMPIPNSNSEKRIPADAVEFNDHYYYVYDIDTITDWNMAQEYCEAQGGYLATITSKEEDEFLYSYITDMGYDSVLFGLSDIDQDNVWTWVTGEPFSYENWASGEPSHQGGYEHYGMYYEKYKDGSWNDGSGKTCPFLCEWGEYQAVESATGIWEELIKSGKYTKYTKDWNQLNQMGISVVPTEYAILDIDGDGWEELILSGHQENLSEFGYYSVLTCNKESKEITVIPIESPAQVLNGSVGQNFQGLQYSSQYHALMYTELNNGSMFGGYNFMVLYNNEIQVAFTVEFEYTPDENMKTYWKREAGDLTHISEVEYNRCIDESKPIAFKAIDEWDDDSTSPAKSQNETNAALGKYLAAAEKTIESGSWSEQLTLEADMSIAYDGGKTKTKMTLNSNSDISNYMEDDLSQIEISSLTDMKMMGQTYSWSTEYKDGVAYCEYTEPFQRSQSLEIDPNIFNFKSISDESILDEEISSSQIRFTVSGEKIAETGIAAVQQISGINNLKYGDVEVIVTLHDSGSINQIVMNFDASVEYQGYDADVTYKIRYSFS